jgi:hypothetical protein
MAEWRCLTETTNDVFATVLVTALEEAEVHAIILNQQDSSYLFGWKKIMVPEEQWRLAEAVLLSLE